MSRQLVALFGPPGSGKSTLVSKADAFGWAGIDAEKLGRSTEDRRSGLRQYLATTKSGRILIGTADLSPDELPTETICVMILPSKDLYLARMRERDRLNPFKQGQDGERKYEAFLHWSKNFPHVIQNDGTIAETFSEIEKILVKSSKLR